MKTNTAFTIITLGVIGLIGLILIDPNINNWWVLLTLFLFPSTTK